MKKQKGLIFLLALSLGAASLGYSQSGTSDNGSDSGSGGPDAKAKAGADANANIVMSAGRAGFVLAPSGAVGMPGPYSSFGGRSEFCYPLQPPTEVQVPLDVLRNFAKDYKFDKKKMDWSVGYPNKGVHNNPITIVNYNVSMVKNDGDVVLANGVVPGEPGRNEYGLIARAVLEAYDRTNTDRVSIVACLQFKQITSGHAAGIGAASAYTPNDSGHGLSFGLTWGKTEAGEVEREVLHIYALNKGEAAFVQKEDTGSSSDKGQKTPPGVQPIKVDVEVKLDLEPLQPLFQELLASKPALANLPVSPVEQCNIDKLTVEYPYDHPKPDEKWVLSTEHREKIAQIASWLKDHPACKVQVQGHASKEGSYDYNDLLGDRRTAPVYDLLFEDGAPPNQVEHASLGKYFPKSDYAPENRRVILVVQGPASGK